MIAPLPEIVWISGLIGAGPRLHLQTGKTRGFCLRDHCRLMPMTAGVCEVVSSVCAVSTCFSLTPITSHLQHCDNLKSGHVPRCSQCLLGMSGDADILLASDNLVLISTLVTWAGFWNNSSSNIKMPQKKQTDSVRQCRRGERLRTTRQFKQQKTTHVCCRQPISEHATHMGSRWMRQRNAAASHAFSSTQLHKPHSK